MACVKKAQINNLNEAGKNEAGKGEWKKDTRGRDALTSDGRVRRGSSPGGWRAGVRPAACPERQRSG